LPFINLGFVVFLFAGLERQGFGELNGNTTQEGIDVVNPTNMTRTCETCHIEGFIRTIAGYTKTSGYMLAGIRTIAVGIACKTSGPAGNINHLALSEHVVKVLGKPDRPTIM